MPNKGINFSFEPNELALCFEPDPTKAKVLYYAKILEQCVGNKNRHGRRKPEYMIHFQGWNSSWDRIVPESFVLKNDDTNRGLMRRLANIARQVKRNKTRRRRIDDILKKHFKRENIHRDSDDDSDGHSCSEDSEDAGQHTDMDDDADLHDDEAEEEGREGTDGNPPAKKQRRGSVDEGEESESSSQATTTQTSDNDDDDDDDDDDRQQHHIDLELPENLRKKLEEDCLNINVHHKLVSLPASPNIVTVLEGYVKNFGVNVLCATGEKNRGNNQCIPPDKNIDICKELVDGLRVMFDFTLPTVLLYTAERQHFQQVSSQQHPALSSARLLLPGVTVKQERPDEDEDEDKEEEEQREEAEEKPRGRGEEEVEEEEEEQPEPVLRPRRRRSSQRLHTTSTQHATSPKLPPKLWPSLTATAAAAAAAAGEDNKEEEEEEEDDEVVLSPRRITRHAYQVKEEVRKRRDSGSGGRATRGATTTTTTTTNNNNSSSRSKMLSERVTPPPPLLIPSHISSQSSTASQPTTPTAAAAVGVPGIRDVRTKEAAVNNIFSWRLFKDDYTGENTPCMIYGPHHLLRLFVKLPDILTEMRLPDISLKHLLRHLELFIDYLSNRSEELFPDSAYVDAVDI